MAGTAVNVTDIISDVVLITDPVTVRILSGLLAINAIGSVLGKFIEHSRRKDVEV